MSKPLTRRERELVRGVHNRYCPVNKCVVYTYVDSAGNTLGAPYHAQPNENETDVLVRMHKAVGLVYETLDMRKKRLAAAREQLNPPETREAKKQRVAVRERVKQQSRDARIAAEVRRLAAELARTSPPTTPEERAQLDRLLRFRL